MQSCQFFEKQIHLSIMGGVPIETSRRGQPRLERIHTIYEVISRRIKEETGIIHITTLPKAGTYNRQRAVGEAETPETLEEAKRAEVKFWHRGDYPDDLRFNTSEAEYTKWEGKLRALCIHYMTKDKEEQMVSLTIDAWSLGGAFIVKFLAQEQNHALFEKLNVRIKGMHCIAPTTAVRTSFDAIKLSRKEIGRLRLILVRAAQNIFVTANANDEILEGRGEREAREIASLINVQPIIETHSKGHLLASHYITDDLSIVGQTVDRTMKMIRTAHRGD